MGLFYTGHKMPQSAHLDRARSLRITRFGLDPATNDLPAALVSGSRCPGIQRPRNQGRFL